MKETINVDVVLSGSSSKYPAHVGFLRGAIDLGLNPIRIIGTSGGAVIGCLLAIGIQPVDMINLMGDVNLGDFISDNLMNRFRMLRRGYLSNGTRYREWLEEITEGKTLGETEIDLSCVASNYTQRRIEIFSSTTHPDISIADAVYASSCLQGAFKPPTINGCSYRDGCLHRFYPWDVWKGIPRPRIGHLIADNDESLIPPGKEVSLEEEIAEYTDQVSYFNTRRALNEGPTAKHKCITVHSNALNLKSFDFNVSKEQQIKMMQEGFDNAKKHLAVLLGST